MASFVLKRVDLFPSGTAVEARKRSLWPTGSEPTQGVAPVGALETSAVSDGVSIGPFVLADETEYVFSGQVGGVWKHTNGRTSIGAAAQSAEVEDTIDRKTREMGVTRPAPGWTLMHAPAANVVATVTKPAVAGVSHVCEFIGASLSAVVAPGAAFAGEIVLRDGAAGVGAIMFQEQIVIPAAIGGPPPINIGGLSLDGTAGNAMTLEFLAAGGANVVERVSLGGFDR